MKGHQQARVECSNCGYRTTINCFPNFEFEKRFYLEFKPECSCGSNEWNINELVEVAMPLSNEEKSLFSMGGKQ